MEDRLQILDTETSPLLERLRGWFSGRIRDDETKPTELAWQPQVSFEDDCECQGLCNRDHEND